MSVLGDRDLSSLLERTSRTFALAIPLLGEPLARQVGVAYLLFRIADTFEDATLWGRDDRHAALATFAAWLDGVTELPDGRPTDDEGCLELLARAEEVRASLDAFPADVRRAIADHVGRTARGMRAFVARQSEGGALVLRDVEDLRAYCYVVAGIVGEMLTDLFVLARPDLPRAELASRARAFGEGLQLVNILKDARDDAKEGRSYLPPGASREEITRLARADLEAAAEYVALLPEGPVRAFCDLPVRLAVATLDALDRGEAKLARADVARILSEMQSAPQKGRSGAP
jgi:farnesyl-diphosphate farnesyltransferase